MEVISALKTSPVVVFLNLILVVPDMYLKLLFCPLQLASLYISMIIDHLECY